MYKDREAVNPMTDGIAKTIVNQITFILYTHLDKCKQLFHKSNQPACTPVFKNKNRAFAS